MQLPSSHRVVQSLIRPAKVYRQLLQATMSMTAACRPDLVSMNPWLLHAVILHASEPVDPLHLDVKLRAVLSCFSPPTARSAARRVVSASPSVCSPVPRSACPTVSSVLSVKSTLSCCNDPRRTRVPGPRGLGSCCMVGSTCRRDAAVWTTDIIHAADHVDITASCGSFSL